MQRLVLSGAAERAVCRVNVERLEKSAASSKCSAHSELRGKENVENRLAVSAGKADGFGWLHVRPPSVKFALEATAALKAS